MRQPVNTDERSARSTAFVTAYHPDIHYGADMLDEWAAWNDDDNDDALDAVAVEDLETLPMPGVTRTMDVSPRPSASGRWTSPARRLNAHDTTLVERTTQILDLIEIVDARAELMLPTAPTERTPVTLLPAGSLAAQAQAIVGRAPRKPASKVRQAAVWLLAISCVVAVLIAVLPLAAPAPLKTTFQPSLPQLVPGAQSTSQTDPTQQMGPWSTGVTVSDTLGLGGGAAPGVKAPGSAGIPVTKNTKPAPAPVTSKPKPPAVSPAPLQPWPPRYAYMYVPGHPAFSVTSSGGFYSWAFGQCTWWAQYKRKDETLTHMGNAMYWTGSAARRGYKTGTVPVRNATVVFQPGVQSAGGVGHVAHVEAVYPGGWFLMSEMNFYVNGGGWGRVDYRFAHAGSGVSFIY